MSWFSWLGNAPQYSSPSIFRALGDWILGVYWQLRDIYRGARYLGDRGVMPRSPQWPSVRRKHLLEEPVCQWCGGTAKLEVHHEIPFSQDYSLELVDHNLITLCEAPIENCHFIRGHARNWRTSVPTIRQDCERHKHRSVV